MLVTCLALVSIAGGASAAPKSGASRAIRADDILLDTTPARQVLSLWKSTPHHGSGRRRPRAEATRIVRTRPYQVLRAFMRQFLCTGTEAEVARAIDPPDSIVCGFDMRAAYQARDSIAAMVKELDARKDGLRRRIAARVARYLPEGHGWKTTSIWFVLASEGMFDAVTLDGRAFERDWRGQPLPPDPALPKSGEPVVLINLTEVLSYGTDTRTRVDELESVLAHEAFHAGMRILEAGLPGWAAPAAERVDGSPRDPDLDYIARVTLDEGIAHYVDWRDRPGADTLFTWKPGANERRAFERLNAVVDGMRVNRRREDRLEALQLAGHGPLWSKYGAISGMFAAHRIEMARGLAAVRQAVAGGPREFLRTYREIAPQNPALLPIPADLIQE